jgi:LuxR family maltose regulon positive regulatory protein
MVHRPRLIEQLGKGFHSGRPAGVTLISAPAGFGKTTLVSAWLDGLRLTESQHQAAWLSLDEGDSDLTRFLTYLAAALQTISPDIGGEMLAMVQSPQPPPVESVLTTLVNDLMTSPATGQNFVLVLDDYHLGNCKKITRQSVR